MQIVFRRSLISFNFFPLVISFFFFFIYVIMMYNNSNSNNRWTGYVPKNFSSSNDISSKKLHRIFKSDYSHVELHRFVHFANLIARSSCTVYLSFSILGLLNLFVAKLHLNERLLGSKSFQNLFHILNSDPSQIQSVWHSLLLNNAKLSNGLYYTPFKYYVMFFVFVSLIFFYADAWIEEMYMESTLFGKYTSKVRGTLVYGFYLFLLSELMVFVGLFWSLYELSGLSQDGEIGSVWFTLSLSDYGSLFLDPLLGTITLFLSGYFVNYAFVKNRIRENSAAKFYLLIGILYGLFFLSIQGSEYVNLADSCSLKAVWGVFFLITGFHGFHVFVGLSFLFQVYMQLCAYDLPGDRMISFFMAVTYWHFVDWVWILVLYRLYDIVNFSFINLLVF